MSSTVYAPLPGAAQSPAWFMRALEVPVEENQVEVDGCKINYLRWGNPEKPGVVLAHGMQAHARIYSFIAPLLLDDFHVAALDFSGMGDSGGRDLYTADLHRREILAVARACGMWDGGKKPFIVGHSFGGAITKLAGIENGNELAGVIIVDQILPRPAIVAGEIPPTDGTEMRDRREVRPNKFYPDKQTILGRFRLSPEQPCDNTYLLDYIAHHSIRQTEEGWTWKFQPNIFQRTHNGNFFNPENFFDIACRRALIYGEFSNSCTEERITAFRALAQGRIPIIMIPVAHHHIMLDQPLALASALKGILATWQGEQSITV